MSYTVLLCCGCVSQLRDRGLPVRTQSFLEAACKPVAQQHLQDARGGTGVGSGLEPAASIGSRDSKCSEDSLLGHLDGDAWLRACRTQREQPSHTVEVAAGGSDAAATPSRAVATGSAAQVPAGLPLCAAVSWPTARYTLREYAEAVALQPGAGSSRVAWWGEGPSVPVLQLKSAGPGCRRDMGGLTSNVAAGAAKAAGSKRPGLGPGEGDLCSVFAGGSSELDILQCTAIPAAIGWVRAHLSELPFLNKGG